MMCKKVSFTSIFSNWFSSIIENLPRYTLFSLLIYTSGRSMVKECSQNNQNDRLFCAGYDFHWCLVISFTTILICNWPFTDRYQIEYVYLSVLCLDFVIRGLIICILLIPISKNKMNWEEIPNAFQKTTPSCLSNSFR